MNHINTNIRFAKEEDAHLIASVHVRSWQKIYKGHIKNSILNNLSIEDRAKQWVERIRKGIDVLVIERNNLVVGFVSISPARDNDLNPDITGEITAFYLHPDFWHQGLGKQLCNRVLIELAKKFKEVVLWVLEGNTQARKFYESMGFLATEKYKLDEYEAGVELKELRYRKKLIEEYLFKPLCEEDLDLLANWLENPHVKEWWNDNLSSEKLKQKYRQRIVDTITKSFIVFLDNIPIGFIQYYYADQVGEGWWPDEIEGTAGIDLFIGEKQYLNKGYGLKILTLFIKELFEKQSIKKIVIDVNPDNQRAIRCYEKVGFNNIGKILTPDGLAVLMELYKDQNVEPHRFLLERPASEVRLYKIIPSNYFLDMLKKHYLYFKRVDAYEGDKRDSEQPEKDKELSKKVTFEKAPSYTLREYYHNFRSRAYACCFSTENTPYLWENYSCGDTNAICLVLNNKKLINYLNLNFAEMRLLYERWQLKNLFHLNYGLVKYISYDEQFIGGLHPNPINYIYIKDRENFSEEKEFRISLTLHGIGTYLLPDGSNFDYPSSIQLGFEFSKAIEIGIIERIILHPDHSDVFREELKFILQGYGLPLGKISQLLE